MLERVAGSCETIVELLPDLKYVVGAIADAIYNNDIMATAASKDCNKYGNGIKVYASRLNLDRRVLSRLEIVGNYHGTGIACQTTECRN